MALQRKKDAPSRSVTEIGPGDFVKIGTQWVPVAYNSAQGERNPRDWTVHTTDGRSRGMLGINRYAKAEDLEER